MPGSSKAACCLGGELLQNFGRARQAAGMGGENAVACCVSWRFRSVMGLLCQDHTGWPKASIPATSRIFRRPAEFDNAERIISQAQSSTCITSPASTTSSTTTVKLYLASVTASGTKGAGWYSFDAGGVHFVGLVNVVNLKAGGLGNLGNEQLEWLEDDLKGRSAVHPDRACSPTSRCGRSIRPWGWGTDDAARALAYLKRFGSVTVLNGHIHQVHAEGRRQRHLPHRALDRLSAAGARHCAIARTDEGRRMKAAHPARHRQHQLQARASSALAIIDTPLQG